MDAGRKTKWILKMLPQRDDPEKRTAPEPPLLTKPSLLPRVSIKHINEIPTNHHNNNNKA
jgi:hypothetical protein